MVSKHRNETIRKRQRFEEKTGWEDINDPVRDRASHKLRALFASAIVFIIAILYLDHIYEIQINDHELYTTKAEDNRIRVRPIEPIRGNILDRNGIVLAESFDTFDIVAKKENITSEEKFIANAKKVFAFDKNDIKLLSDQFNNKKLKEITLKKIQQLRSLLNFQWINIFCRKWNLLLNQIVVILIPNQLLIS